MPSLRFVLRNARSKWCDVYTWLFFKNISFQGKKTVITADILLLFGLLQVSINSGKLKVHIVQLNALNGNQISMNAENTN